MKPGEIITCKEEDFINANEGLETIMLRSAIWEIVRFRWGVICIFRSQPGTKI